MTYEFRGTLVTGHVKAGRSWNGAHRDVGVVVHAVPVQPRSQGGPHFEKAVCGTSPGRRGYGWSETDKEINCGKCLATIAKALNINP